MCRLFLFLSLALLASCRSSQPVDFPPLTFKKYAPIYLNVASIQVIDEYKSPQQEPYVEHLLPYSPEDAMRIWVKDRIRAVGLDNTLHVIIKDGSVKATTKKAENSFSQFLTIDQNRSYDMKLEVEMRIYDGVNALSKASVRAKATRMRTMPRDASVMERNAQFRAMIADLMESLNAELEKNIFMHMGNYISYSSSP
jgi:hypothetical protein